MHTPLRTWRSNHPRERAICRAERLVKLPRIVDLRRSRQLLPQLPIRCHHRSSGFTLLELLVVVAIIALLAAYVGPKFFAQVGRSEQSVARSQIEAFGRALGAYRLDVGQLPSTEDGLDALVKRPPSAAKWNGPYLEKAVPVDSWGRPYLYQVPGSAGADYDIVLLGKDGQPGGSGDAADVSNH